MFAAAVALLGLGCDADAACKKSPTCTESGLCSADDSGACVAKTEADCKLGTTCTDDGKCSAKEGVCIVGSDGDCQGSKKCKDLGLCNVDEGMCVDPKRTFTAACGTDCKASGKCFKKSGACVALGDAHCRGTTDTKAEDDSPCDLRGECTAQDGACAAASNDDCKKGKTCRKEKTGCTAKAGKCVASDAECADSTGCVSSGLCAAGDDGLCAATEKDHCKKSVRCNLEGLCSPKEGKCIAMGVDCGGSMVCKKDRRCRVKDGVCSK
jgi:hypothetical protein